MASLIKSSYLPIFLVIFITIFTFFDLPKTFYQQDEWQVLGHNLSQGFENIVKYTNPIQLFFAEQRPLNRVLNQIFFGIFKFDTGVISYFAIFFHTLNSILVFILAKKLTNNNLISFFASLFFSVSSVSHQAVTWPAASLGTLPATALILLSIISYFNFIKIQKKKDLYLSFFLGLIALFFKEIALLLFILFPVIYVIYKKDASIKDILKVHFLPFVYGSLLISFRTFEIFIRSEPAAGFVKGSDNFAQSIFFHLLLYPLSSLFQIFISPSDLYQYTSSLTVSQYKFLIDSPLRELVAQSIVADLVSVLGSFLLLGIVLIIIQRFGDKTSKKNIIFFLLFLFLSFLPYIVIHRESSYLSSRYFYVGAIGASILFGYFIYFISTFSKSFKWVIFIFAFIFLYHHASIIRKDINYQVKLGDERKAVLDGIKRLKPTLNNKTVFYVTSDKVYYGPVTNPFQNGLGYVIAVWYYDGSNIPKEFLSENFLWDLGVEGYKEKDNLGFGYYQDVDKMVKDMKKNNLSENNVYGYFIRSSDTKVLDITKETRERISTVSAIKDD